jgi:hypothetical protein
MIDPELRRACAIVVKQDTRPLRRALFARLAARTPALRVALAAWERLGAGRRAAAFVSPLALQCFLEVRPPRRDADLLGVWKYENERRQLAALSALDPAIPIEMITLEPTAAATVLDEPRSAGALARVPEAWDLLREYATRGDFLVAARVACTIGYYLRMLPLLRHSRAAAVLVSSDSNPYAMALVHAARRLGRRTCFVTHGHVAAGPPPLDFDLSLLDGPVVREVYERAGAIRAAVVFKGSEGRVRPMDTSRLRGGVRTLGVVLSILVDWPRVGALLDRLRADLSPERIVLRLHPNRTMLDPQWARHVSLAGVRVSRGERPLTEDAEACDLVVAGNTSAHLTVLKLGVPTAYLPALDDVGADYYDFVNERIVAPIADDGSIDVGAIARFYDDPGWAPRFARFDAGYPDRQEACDRAVLEGLRALLERRA